MTPEEGLEGFLRNVAGMKRGCAGKAAEGLRYVGVEELILASGRPYRPGDPPETVGEVKGCFPSAYKAAEAEGLTYVEGYAIPEDAPIPLPHAWTVTEDGEARDPTWCEGVRPSPDYPDLKPNGTPGIAYFGIPLSLDFVRSHVAETGFWGVLFPDLPQDAVRLLGYLREGLPEGAVLQTLQKENV